ncbi:hypothetical protein Lal_00042376 [Lupinus albus]|nr:hypothetical protein Lal_00042376 [Lupinus albus]
MTRRNTGILHSINPEIDRTYHRLVRQNRTLDTNFVSVSEHPVAEYSDSVHSVAFPNFDHSVHSENMAQPPTPPGPRERTLRELAAPDFTYDSLSIIDAASGGALGDMTPFEARCLIEKMASNSQQFNARSGDAIVVRGVHDVGTNATRQDKLETKIDSLTTLITQLAINQQKSSMARVCGICTSSDHYSDMCPSLLEPRTGDHLEAYAANMYNNRPPHQQQHYDPPSSSTYNPGWRNQAPFQNNNVGQNRSSYVPPPIQQQRNQMINTPAPTKPSLEELVRQMTMQNMQFQQETRASIQRQDFCIDEFLNIDIDIDAPDWTPPFDLECDIVVYALGTVLARVQKVKRGGHIWHQEHFGHYKWKMRAKVKIKQLYITFSFSPFWGSFSPSHESPRPSMLTRPRRHIFSQFINDVSHARPSIKQAIHTFSSA